MSDTPGLPHLIPEFFVPPAEFDPLPPVPPLAGLVPEPDPLPDWVLLPGPDFLPLVSCDSLPILVPVPLPGLPAPDPLPMPEPPLPPLCASQTCGMVDDADWPSRPANAGEFRIATPNSSADAMYPAFIGTSFQRQQMVLL
ncbi:MAG TPA: hypothetical protein VFQ34_02830 [Nitrospiraceae bacterium]|nr:hypothetical protein [Nitrospiraceae bacterium]